MTSRLVTSCAPRPSDCFLIEIADRNPLSYCDALILAAASRAGCERLLTEDLADGSMIAGVLVTNPFK